MTKTLQPRKLQTKNLNPNGLQSIASVLEKDTYGRFAAFLEDAIPNETHDDVLFFMNKTHDANGKTLDDWQSKICLLTDFCFDNAENPTALHNKGLDCMMPYIPLLKDCYRPYGFSVWINTKTKAQKETYKKLKANKKCCSSIRQKTANDVPCTISLSFLGRTIRQKAFLSPL